MGGLLSEHVSLAGVFWGMTPLIIIWAFMVMTMERPRHLTNYMVNITSDENDSELLESKLLAISGVHEVVVMLKEHAAYFKGR